MSPQPVDINDCFLHDKDRLRHGEALALLRERLSCCVGLEAVPLNDALGRILSKDVVAPHMVPMHTNAAVDGFAFRHADLGSEPVSVSQTIAAGNLAPAALTPGSAARIFTGAIMPKGADSVAMQEDCTHIGDQVTLPASLRAGANCRLAGEDLNEGDLVMKAGARLRAADLAALASIGQSTLDVHRKLRVALISSGDELRRVGASSKPLRPGEVYDANAPMLAALMHNLPIEFSDLGIIPDDAKMVKTALYDAAQNHDVVLTTGGASRGREDHMLTTLDELGKRHLWQLAVKPGRPMMFGQIAKASAAREPRRDCLFFGLPGNPVAAMVCFLLYTRPSLLQLAGAQWETPQRFQIPAAFDVPSKKADRREFMRGILKTDVNGQTSVEKFKRDGSGLISSLREADGLIEIDEETKSIAVGDLVSFIPFSAFY